jgi:hypothetical protein
VNVVKTTRQYEVEARWLLTEMALEKAEAAVEGRRYRPSAKQTRAIKAVAKAIAFADAQEAAIRKARRAPRPPRPETYRAEIVR